MSGKEEVLDTAVKDLSEALSAQTDEQQKAGEVGKVREKKEKPKKDKAPKQKSETGAAGQGKVKEVKKETQLGLSATKSDDFSEWYTQHMETLDPKPTS